MEVADTFDYVCPLIARSTQITDLKIVTELDGQLKESNVLDLVVWFSSQPVRMLSLGGYHEWDDIDIAVRQKYYEAMVNCSTLDELVPMQVKLHTEIAHSIAMALETNEFICELDLSGSSVAMEDFETLIKSMTHPSRPVATKRIIWMRKYRKTAHAEPLAQLKQLAEDRGGEFIF
ncbi:unnamed protein product [Aphanomyces euteiches]